MTFADFNLSKQITEALIDLKYEVPSPIQQKAIPILLQEKDLVGCAQTGTGKTAAFAIPIIQYLQKIVTSAKKRKQIRSLILSPTRELAVQIAENITQLAQYTPITTTVIYGGVTDKYQVENLKNGVDIVVATPGRFLDLYKQNKIVLDGLHHLILDEADLMLDMGFLPDVKKIIKLTPENRQTILFSATMPMEIRVLADEFMKNPQYVQIEVTKDNKISLIEKVYFVEKELKRALLLDYLKNNPNKEILIFARTKAGADKIAELLNTNGFKADALHGDKSQAMRLQILENFKEKNIDILVATDVAARGIDIHALPLVINYDIPNQPEIYIHRIGRSARAGKEGMAISFVGKDEANYWKEIEKLIKRKIKIVDNHDYQWKNSDKKSQNQSTKPDRRNSKNPKSRKSSASKKNKKRWY